jgi:hypothetical protein
MAYRLRSAIGKSFGQIEDSRERLATIVAENNFADVVAITHIINGLEGASIPLIDAAVLRSENKILIMEDMLVLLKAEIKRKEALIKVRFWLNFY